MLNRLLATTFIASVFSFSHHASAQDATFTQCLDSLTVMAQQQGVTESTRALIPTFAFQSRVIELDRNQPEFVQTFPAYFSKRVNDWRINKGRQMLAKHKAFLAELTAKYGVPGHYLVAFWGLETNYGGYKGTMPTLDSLATLACDARRKTFFTNELMLALKLVDREKLNPDNMKGSWAGAMGHTQFMPSTYTQYAIDGDQDGTIDLWNSEQDALASAANFLARLGWQAGSRWGREVSLPDDFDYALAGRKHKRSLTEWAQLGVADANGNALPESTLVATLRVPSGHQGPVFVTYPNFRIIMRWNNSEFYAIAVGQLADQIIHGPGLVAPLPELAPLSRQVVKVIQQQLNQLGFDVGFADGIMGPATRAGIRAYQAQYDLVADGFPSDALVEHLSNTTATPAE